MSVPPSPPKRAPSPCALCFIYGHATHQCHEFPILKHNHPAHAVTDDQSIPIVQVSILGVTKQCNNNLHTNYACALCGFYGHYSHTCSELPKFRTTLADLHGQSHPTPMEEVLPPATMIKGAASIWYLSTFLSSLSYVQSSCSSSTAMCPFSKSLGSIPLSSMGFTSSVAISSSVGVTNIHQESYTNGVVSGSSLALRSASTVGPSEFPFLRVPLSKRP